MKKIFKTLVAMVISSTIVGMVVASQNTVIGMGTLIAGGDADNIFFYEMNGTEPITEFQYGDMVEGAYNCQSIRMKNEGKVNKSCKFKAKVVDNMCGEAETINEIDYVYGMPVSSTTQIGDGTCEYLVGLSAGEEVILPLCEFYPEQDVPHNEDTPVSMSFNLECEDN